MRPLYKIVMLFACVACCASASAQIRTVTFTGRDRTNQYHIPLSRVNVFNLDQLWEEILYYPDTVLILGTVGVEDYESQQNVQLMQNVPNPFNGTTEFALRLPDGGDVFLEIYDITGRLAVAERFTALPVGTHLFQATLSSPQTYLLSAKVDNGKMTIKMVNEGHGAGNTIHHLGMTDKNGDFTLYLKNDKASSNYPFHIGDEMQYVGIALLDGTQWESAVVTQPQVYNDTVPLFFDITLPTVQTSWVVGITTFTATCGGNVTSDGNAPVTARGVCWDTLPNPTVSGAHSSDSTGTGSFTSNMTGLADGTTYYVRAYATNSVGTAYGEEKTFSTLVLSLPTVQTGSIVNITAVSATCGGNVSSNGNAPVTDRGICYGTSPNPTVNSNHISAATAGNGSFTVDLSALTPNTTYYVCAYATNSKGTAYGDQQMFSTLPLLLPSVITNAVSNVTISSATCGGNVSSDGNSPVTARGVCWSTSPNPTISNSHTTDGTGIGGFSSSMTGLTAGTTYYVRAYATNGVGTAYGEQRTFTTLSLPFVTTDTVSNITGNTAVCGGNVISEGDAPVTARGVCWSISQNPTVDDSHTTENGGVGSFSSSITGLNAGVRYYVRAYATSNAGTAYGEQVTFVTTFTCGSNTVIDHDGNSYNTVQIGNQCWMKENLRTIHYADGTSISLGSSSTSTPHYYYPNNDSSTMFTYGLLYNWYAVMHGASSSDSIPSGIQGICPNGWHVPSHAEWTQLTTYVGSQGQYWCSGDNISIAKAMAAKSGWTSSSYYCAVGNNPSANNATGFSALPAGSWIEEYYVLNDPEHYSYQFGEGASFWSSTIYKACYIYYSHDFVALDGGYGLFKPLSVRCLRDMEATIPTVTTNAVSNIMGSSALCGGNVTDAGGAVVTARGVCWDTLPNPTVDDSFTVDSIGVGSFTSYLSGLADGTTYYVRAYATNGVGTAYGEQRTFTTLSLPLVTTDTVSNITGSTAVCGGNVISEGDAPVTARGVCWSTSINPTVDGQHTTIYGSGTGSFSSNLSGLTGGTTYYVRAYATSSLGTLYGEQRTFTTAFTCGNIIADYDGNSYNTVQIGNQCWMKENLKTAHLNNGVSILLVQDSTSWGYSSSPAYCYYNQGTYGCLYNYYAVESGQLCPPGWHVPTYNEVHTILLYTLGSSDAGGKMKTTGTTYWLSPNTGATNSSGFSARGSGLRYPGHSISGIKERAVYWTSNTYNDDYAYDFYLCYDQSYLQLYGVSAYDYSIWKRDGLSVRCLRDDEINEVSNPCPGLPTVTDYDGNVYHTVQIGGQCWMKENLRTTRYADGTEIALAASNTDSSSTVAYRYNPGNHSFNVSTYGYLYNWPAVMNGEASSSSLPSNVQGICPMGWHVPSDAEWTQLTDYVSSQNEYVCNNNSGCYAKALSSNKGWAYYTDACTVGFDLSSNNAAGFSALPAGYIYLNYINNFGRSAEFWSATLPQEEGVVYPYPYKRAIHRGHYDVVRATAEKEKANSVRCLRDGGGIPPTVTTNTVSNVTATSVVCGGNVTNAGSAPVTSRGVCWSTLQNPTIIDSHTSNSSGLGNFTSNITGLITDTTYYLRAYATNAAGTAYGAQVNFTPNIDGQPCPGTPTVTDVDNNVYNTVQIGQQCWMKENLRTTRYANGTSISSGSIGSTTTAYRYCPNNNSSNVSAYGYLYNWKAVMHNSSSSSINPSGVQGICPNGWHVPSKAEWRQLTQYVSNQNQYLCSNTYAKALASTLGWSTSSILCAVGNDQSSNNATGFSAMPAGGFSSGGGYFDFGNSANFWSASEVQGEYNNLPIPFEIRYDECVEYSVIFSAMSNGHSVRCLRD